MIARAGRPLLVAAAVAAALLHPTPAADAAGAVEPVGLTMTWVGDIAFSSDRGMPAGGAARALAPVRRQLDADLVTGNLEGTLTSGGSSKCGGRDHGNCFAFRAPPSTAGALRRTGFDLLNTANNHANDFGAHGRASTLAALRGAGIAHTGRPGEIAVLRAGDVRVAAVGFASYPWSAPLLDVAAAQRLVRAARRRAPVVLAFFHGGAEGAGATRTPFGPETAFGERRGSLRRFAHAMIDAGASVVLGSGPHVIRGVERYRNGLVAYSLGNFAGPDTLALGGVLSLSAILRVDLSPRGKVIGGRWIGLRLVRPGLPRYDPGASLALVRRLSRRDFGSRGVRFAGDGSFGAATRRR